MSWKMYGLKAVENEINESIRYERMRARKGIEAIANAIYVTSQTLVPVDTGRLKASGEVIIEGGFGTTIAYVSYEAFDPKTGYEYAPIQHEVLGFNHKIGQAKYLEDAVREIEPRVREIYEKVSDF